MGDSLVVQWLRPTTFTAEGMGLIPGQGTKIRKPHTQQKKKKKKMHERKALCFAKRPTNKNIYPKHIKMTAYGESMMVVVGLNGN